MKQLIEGDQNKIWIKLNKIPQNKKIQILHTHYKKVKENYIKQLLAWIHIESSNELLKTKKNLSVNDKSGKGIRRDIKRSILISRRVDGMFNTINELKNKPKFRYKLTEEELKTLILSNA